jgi:hypothetical protein
MKRFAVPLLALGLVAAIGTASAQSPGYGSSYGYGQPTVDRYGQDRGAYYDYARVLRVDPVFVQGRGSDWQHCEGPDNGYAGTYAGGGYGNGGYRNGDYGNANDDRYYGSAGDDRYYGDGGRRDDSDDRYAGDGGYRNDGYRSTAGANVATVIGGLVGAAVGSQVGGGSARYATAALGTMVGGMAGRQVYENTHRPQRLGRVQVCDVIPAGRSGYGYGRDARADAYDVTYEYAGRTWTTRTRYNPGDRIRVRVDVSAD